MRQAAVKLRGLAPMTGVRRYGHRAGSTRGCMPRRLRSPLETGITFENGQREKVARWSSG